MSDVRVAIFVADKIKVSNKVSHPPELGDEFELGSQDEPTIVVVVRRRWRNIKDDFQQHLDVYCEEKKDELRIKGARAALDRPRKK